MKLVRQIRNMNVIKSAASHRKPAYPNSLSQIGVQKSGSSSQSYAVAVIKFLSYDTGICSHRSSSAAAKKLFYPSADRNKEPILSILRQYIRSGCNQNLLEISSGTGQHVAYFAPYFPQVTFYPSEYDSQLLESIAAYTKDLSNVEPPIEIDAARDYESWHGKAFKENSFDYIYNCNMIHVSPIACSIGLFRNAGKLLKQNGILFTYGAYMINGIISPESNVAFNKSLKAQNPEWGLRDVADLEKLANENGIHLIKIFDMPANNKTIVWEKK